MSKIYECCICHTKFNKTKPIRLVKQLYSGKYNQYGYAGKYDFCRRCYDYFDLWVYNHNREVND